MEADNPSPELPKPSAKTKKPIVCLVIGMAGTGKTTTMHRLALHVEENNIPAYFVNLDPAVLDTPYEANIDICDSVKYHEVMKQYKLGPNGAILTSLNLFATRFDQVVGFIEKNTEADYVFIDTPGQIEVFTWSASGQVITEALSSSFPTCVLYIADTPRSCNATTFMANMTYACSILYKTQLPFALVFNKIDVVPADKCIKWMRDCDNFRDEMMNHPQYSVELARSMALMLEEFYKNLTVCSMSAVTGEGTEGLFEAIDKCKKEYDEVFYPEMVQLHEEIVAKREQKQKAHVANFMRDLEEDKGRQVVVDGRKGAADSDSDGSVELEAEEEEEEDCMF